MGTKKEPGQFDCYNDLAEDEPYFTLRAKDPMAPALVELWANIRASDPDARLEKIYEARAVARAMRAWRKQNVFGTKQRS